MKLAKLRTLLKDRGLTQTDLAQLLKRDKSAVTNLLQGKRLLKAEEAILIASHLNVPVTEVLGMEENNKQQEMDEPVLIPFQHAPTTRRRQPDHIIKKQGKFYVQSSAPMPEKAFALEVRDESMNLSGILPGDIIISALDIPCRSGQIVIAQHYQGRNAETILRKYVPPLLLPHSSHAHFTPLHEQKDDVRMVSPVLQVIRYL